jgi:hypothetical protein
MGQMGAIGTTGQMGQMGATWVTGQMGQMGATGASGQGFSVVGTNYGNILYWNGTSFTSSSGKVSIGDFAGQINQSNNSVAIGSVSGYDNQGEY